MGKAWLIASGKGGVGKSTLSACLGRALSRAGKQVCIIDADIGLRDQDVILGLENSIVYDLIDVTEKDCRLHEALVSPEGYPRLKLLPASQFARVKELEPKAFRKVLRQLKVQNDYVLIDCPAGIERGLRGLMSEEIEETVVVCTPDDMCIRNAERVVGLLIKKHLPKPRLVVNRLDARLVEAGEMYAAAIVAEVLDLQLLGEVPEDPTVYRALLGHKSLMNVDCPASNAIERIALRMDGQPVELPGIGTKRPPWYQRMFRPRLKEVTPIDC